MPKKKNRKWSFVDRYREHNDALTQKQMREQASAERSSAEINERLRQWRVSTARRLGQ